VRPPMVEVRKSTQRHGQTSNNVVRHISLWNQRSDDAPCRDHLLVLLRSGTIATQA
jgi:hypothetical protein